MSGFLEAGEGNVMMVTKYPQLKEGDLVVLNPQKQIFGFACCDCGLVHDIEFVVGHRQKLIIKMVRNNRKTAAYRREKKKRQRNQDT